MKITAAAILDIDLGHPILNFVFDKPIGHIHNLSFT